MVERDTCSIAKARMSTLSISQVNVWVQKVPKVKGCPEKVKTHKRAVFKEGEGTDVRQR